MDVKYIPADWEKMRSGIKGLIGYGVYGKGMFEELKKLNEVLEDAEDDIAKYDADRAISFSHNSQKSTYQSMFEKFEVLYQFTGKVDNIVDRTIDQPFYEDMDAFVAAMEEATISKYETTNRIGATETHSIGYDIPTVIEVPKAKVSLDDLLSGGNFYSEQMKLEYEEWKKLNPEQDLSQDEYQLAAVNMRAFEYESIRDKQENVEFWTQIGALVVIVGATLIFPPAGLTFAAIYGTLELSSAIRGEDWASHRELGTGERWFRGLLAPLDILPAAAVLSKFTGSAARFGSLTDNFGNIAVKSGVKEGIQQSANQVDNLIDDAAKEIPSRLKSADAALDDQTSVNALKAAVGDETNLANSVSSSSSLNLTSTRKMSDLVDDVGEVNRVSQPNESRGQYLRNKHGSIDSQELHARINIRGINEEAIKYGSEKTWDEFVLHNSKSGVSLEELKDSYILLIEKQSPWPEGFKPIERTLKPGETFEMVLDNNQPLNRPGGFGTFDKIEGIDYAKNQLAIKSDWKQDFGKVVTYRVKDNVEIPVLEGPVGPQIDLAANKYLPGGGSQIQLLIPRNIDKMEYLEVISVRINK